MQKILKLLKSGSGALFLGVICASIGSALFIPSTGIVTTLPFIVLFSVIPALILEKSYPLPFMFFAVSYFFCFAKDVPLKYDGVIGGWTFYVSAFAAVISALSCIAVYFLKSALKNKDKRWSKLALVGVLVLLAVFGTCYINGTPWGLANAKSEILAYAKENYALDELELGGVYFVPKGDYYACDAKIVGTEDRGSFISDNKLTSSLDALAVKYAGEEKAREIGALLRKAFPEDSFTVNPDTRSFEGVKISFTNTKEIEKLLSYTITIHSEETAKSFVKKTSAYVNLIGGSDIDCSSISVNGGAKQKLYYTLRVDTTAPMRNINKLLRIYSTCSLPQNSVIAAHNTFSK